MVKAHHQGAVAMWPQTVVCAEQKYALQAFVKTRQTNNLYCRSLIHLRQLRETSNNLETPVVKLSRVQVDAVVMVSPCEVCELALMASADLADECCTQNAHVETSDTSSQGPLVRLVYCL